MTSQTIMRIEQQMLAYLDNSQMKQLHTVLSACLQEPGTEPDTDHVQLFLAAKRVEGCSEKTIRYYSSTLKNVLTAKNAKVLDVKEMGQKELAYEMNKYKTGYYFLFTIESETDEATREFDRLALISEDIIRHLVVKVEE